MREAPVSEKRPWSKWPLGRLRTILLVVAGMNALALSADEPLRPPYRYTTCSPAETFCVTSDPTEGTSVHPAGAPERPLWTLPGWFRVADVSDDGRHLVTGYDGMNLVPRRDPERVTVLTFWHEGKQGVSYTLGDLGYESSDLQATVSHYYWGDYLGFDEDGRFRLRMVDGAVLRFDPATGKRIEAE